MVSPESSTASRMSRANHKSPKAPMKTVKTSLDTDLVEKAVNALIKYHNGKAASKNSLLGNEAFVQVQIGLEVPPARAHPKPIRIIIPHSMRKVSDEGDDDDDENLQEPEVCLIVKEESKPWVQEMIQQFPDHMGCIKKVLGLQSLRTKHKQYQQRRDLLHKYTLFMADDRILPMLTTALGKDFFKAKKQPIPVRLTRKEALPFAIRKALSATFMTLSRGTCITILAGNTDMDQTKLVENVLAVATHAVDKVPRKWSNVRSISIKTADSMALPFYNKMPEELMELTAMAGHKPVWKDEEEEKSEGQDEDGDIRKHVEEKKSRKRELKSKSPLLRALKKQKQMNDKVEKDDEDTADKQNKESRDRQTKNNGKQQQERGLGEVEQKHKAEKTKAQVDEKDGNAVGTKIVKTAKEKDETTKKNKKQKTMEAADDEAEKLKKKQKKGDEKAKMAEKAEKKSGKEPFIRSKKYKGTKIGYVFKKDKEGIGYYLDKRPAVDKMALEALLRMAAQNKKSGGRRKSAGGKKQRGRR